MDRRDFLKSSLASYLFTGIPQTISEEGSSEPESGRQNWRTFGADLANTSYVQREGPTEQVGARWIFETDYDVLSSPAVVDGVVYVGSDDGVMYALDRDTGEPVWCRRLNEGAAETGASIGIDSSPTVVDGSLYIGNRVSEESEPSFYCLDADDGEVIWKTDEMETDEDTQYGNAWVRSSPAVYDGKVYFGSWDNSFYCFDAQNGEKLWDYETGSLVYPSPAVVNGSVYFGSHDSYLYCLDAETGEEEWRYETERTDSDDTEQSPVDSSASIAASPAVWDGVVYFTETSGNAYAVDADNGSVVWISEGVGLSNSAPAVDGERMYTSRSHDIVALDMDNGEVVWSYETEEGIYASNPSVTDDAVYMGSNEGYLRALKPETGELLWKFETGDRQRSMPAVSNGDLYFGSRDSKVYAVEQEPGGETAVTSGCEKVLGEETGEEEYETSPENKNEGDIKEYLQKIDRYTTGLRSVLRFIERI